MKKLLILLSLFFFSFIFSQKFQEQFFSMIHFPGHSVSEHHNPPNSKCHQQNCLTVINFIPLLTQIQNPDIFSKTFKVLLTFSFFFVITLIFTAYDRQKLWKSFIFKPSLLTGIVILRE